MATLQPDAPAVVASASFLRAVGAGRDDLVHPRLPAGLGVKSRRVGTLGAYRASLGASTLSSMPTRGGKSMLGPLDDRRVWGANSRATTEDPMDPASGVITHAKLRMWLRPDGIVQVVLAPRAAIVLEDAIAATEAVTRLTGGRLSPLLVDLRDASPQARSARLEFARRDDVVSAVALIVGTPLGRMMGNLFISLSKPLFPTRLFDNEASALAWLQAFVGERQHLN